jgi:hypothetical protein
VQVGLSVTVKTQLINIAGRTIIGQGIGFSLRFRRSATHIANQLMNYHPHTHALMVRLTHWGSGQK